MKSIFPLTFVLMLIIGFTACSGTKKHEQYAGVDGDFINETPLPDRLEGSNFFGGNVKRGQFSPIYFGFDQFTISGAELRKIREIAESIKRSPNTFIIAGFTDDRGTQEYNRALGERRANAAREALIRSGVKGNRLQTVSFGQERPADAGSNEAAWAKNRRAEIGEVR